MAAPMSAAADAPKAPAESPIVDGLAKRKEAEKQASALPVVRIECQVASNQMAEVEKLLAGAFKQSQAEALHKDADSDSHRFEGEATRSDLLATVHRLQAMPGNRVTTTFGASGGFVLQELESNAPAVAGRQIQAAADQKAQGGVKHGVKFDEANQQKPAGQTFSGMSFSLKSADERVAADKPQPAKPADRVDASRVDKAERAGRGMAAGPATAAEPAAPAYRVVVVVRPLPMADAAAKIASPAAKAEAKPAAAPASKP